MIKDKFILAQNSTSISRTLQAEYLINEFQQQARIYLLFYKSSEDVLREVFQEK